MFLRCKPVVGVAHRTDDGYAAVIQTKHKAKPDNVRKITTTTVDSPRYHTVVYRTNPLLFLTTPKNLANVIKIFDFLKIY